MLGGLKTAFKPEGGVVTAGNASQIYDGSAALLMMTGERASELGLRPLARVHTAVLAGADPVMMLTAPIPATEKALSKPASASALVANVDAAGTRRWVSGSR